MTNSPARQAVSLPAPALRPFISHYAGFHVEGLPPATHAGLPSRHAHLIISFAEPIELLRAPGGRHQSGRFTALVGGLHEAPALVRQELPFLQDYELASGDDEADDTYTSDLPVVQRPV